jgi:hypothetical protein
MEFYKTVIGSDWKYFDMNTFSYSVTDSLVYFVQSLSGDIYKFVPLSFSGQSEGKTVFTHELVSMVNISENNAEAGLRIFPNPASDQVNIDLTGLTTEKVTLEIYDLSGRLLLQQEQMNSANTLKLSVQEFKKGLYLLQLRTAEKVYSQQLIVK